MDRTGAIDHAAQALTTRLFSVEDARRALPYVARIVRDAVEAYRRVQSCRARLRARSRWFDAAAIADERDAAIHELNGTIDECNAVGAELVNLADGVVAFRAHVEGRPATLVWRLGEPLGDAWADLQSPVIA